MKLTHRSRLPLVRPSFFFNFLTALFSAKAASLGSQSSTCLTSPPFLDNSRQKCRATSTPSSSFTVHIVPTTPRNSQNYMAANRWNTSSKDSFNLPPAGRRLNSAVEHAERNAISARGRRSWMKSRRVNLSLPPSWKAESVGTCACTRSTATTLCGRMKARYIDVRECLCSLTVLLALQEQLGPLHKL